MGSGILEREMDVFAGYEGLARMYMGGRKAVR